MRLVSLTVVLFLFGSRFPDTTRRSSWGGRGLGDPVRYRRGAHARRRRRGASRAPVRGRAHLLPVAAVGDCEVGLGGDQAHSPSAAADLAHHDQGRSPARGPPWASSTYANSITLTPGTITTGVKGNVLTVHALVRDGALDLEGGGMDARVSQFEGSA